MACFNSRAAVFKFQIFKQAVGVRIESGIVPPLDSRRSRSEPLNYAGKGASPARRNRLVPPELTFALLLLSLVLTAWRMLILWGIARMNPFAFMLWFLLYPEAYLLGSVASDPRWWLYAAALYIAGTFTIVLAISVLIRIPVVVISSLVLREETRR